MSLSLQNLLVSLFWVAKLPVPSLPSPAHVSPLCPYLLPHSLLQCTGLLAPSRINQACSLHPVLAIPWAWTASPRWSRGSSLISFKSLFQVTPDRPYQTLLYLICSPTPTRPPRSPSPLSCFILPHCTSMRFLSTIPCWFCLLSVLPVSNLSRHVLFCSLPYA